MGPPDDDLTAAPGGAAWPQHGDREHALDLWRGGERLLFDCGEGTQRQLLRSIGLVDLEEVVRMMARLDVREPVVGMPVEVFFERVDDQLSLPHFKEVEE